MLNQCPFCQQPLRFSEEQASRLEQALFQLVPGKLLHLKCPHCRETIGLDKSGQPPRAADNRIAPPPPPSLDWLHAGVITSYSIHYTKLYEIPSGTNLLL